MRSFNVVPAGIACRVAVLGVLWHLLLASGCQVNDQPPPPKVTPEPAPRPAPVPTPKPKPCPGPYPCPRQEALSDNPVADAVGKVVRVEAHGRGAGIPIAQDLVLTCLHLLGPARKATVELKGGRVIQAWLLAGAGDLALLRVGGRARLSALPLASAPARQGDEVFAIGHPYGFTWTLTRGIVSGTGRPLTLPNAVTLTDVLQTDAAINRGNSGGPLVNGRGEVVGVVCAMIEGAHGMGFAMSAASATAFVKESLR
jgi:S1-C subfamily serine protease